MNCVSMRVYLTNKDARPFSERRIFFDQQGVLNPFKYFMYGDSIKDEHTDTSKCVTHLYQEYSFQ